MAVEGRSVLLPGGGGSMSRNWYRSARSVEEIGWCWIVLWMMESMCALAHLPFEDAMVD